MNMEIFLRGSIQHFGNTCVDAINTGLLCYCVTVLPKVFQWTNDKAIIVVLHCWTCGSAIQRTSHRDNQDWKSTLHPSAIKRIVHDFGYWLFDS